MATQEQYDILHKELAEKFSCSPRVIQYIRSSYHQQYKNESFEEARVHMYKHCEKVLVEIMRTYRQVKIDYATLVLKEVNGLKHSNRRVLQLQEELKHIVGFTDKVGFRKSIIGFLKHCSDETFKAILEAEVH